MWIRLAVHSSGRVRFLTVPFKRSMPVRQDNATLLSPSPWLRSTHTHTAIWQPCQADSKRGRGRGRGPRPESSCSVEIRLNRSLCWVIWGEIPTHSDQTLLAFGNTLIVLLCRTYFIYFGNCKIHVNVRTTNSSDIHSIFDGRKKVLNVNRNWIECPEWLGNTI